MLSILIPTYNFYTFPLVKELHTQCVKFSIEFEILVYDDYSTLFIEENKAINSLEKCTYIILKQNIGRSKIRNLLAKNATFKWLLFLDADTFPCNSNFIEKYIHQLNEGFKIYYGGILYEKNKPKKENLLRWVYGRKREALSVEKREKDCYLRFLTLNFLIHKSVFNEVSFNEEIPNFRHEDTLFSYNLKTKNISLNHIDNPVFHLGLDSTKHFIEKDKLASKSLKLLIEQNLIPRDYISLSKNYFLLNKTGFVPIFNFFFKILNPLIIKNLVSNKPSLFLFDLIRLHYFIQINHKKWLP